MRSSRGGGALRGLWRLWGGWGPGMMRDPGESWKIGGMETFETYTDGRIELERFRHGAVETAMEGTWEDRERLCMEEG